MYPFSLYERNTHRTSQGGERTRRLYLGDTYRRIRAEAIRRGVTGGFVARTHMCFREILLKT